MAFIARRNIVGNISELEIIIRLLGLFVFFTLIVWITKRPDPPERQNKRVDDGDTDDGWRGNNDIERPSPTLPPTSHELAGTDRFIEESPQKEKEPAL